jgi:hypothetical protein
MTASRAPPPGFGGGGRSPDFGSGSSGFGSQGFGSSSGGGFGYEQGAGNTGYGGGSSYKPAPVQETPAPQAAAAPRNAKDRKGMDLKGKKKEDVFGDFGGDAGFDSFKADALSAGIAKGSSHAAAAQEVKSNMAG